MQLLSTSQSDAIMDLVKQCYTVTSAWESHQADTRSRALSPKTQSLVATRKRHFEDERKLCIDIYHLGLEVGVQAGVLDGVLTRNLPQDLREALHPVTAA